jgi:hypothetical protein
MSRTEGGINQSSICKEGHGSTYKLNIKDRARDQHLACKEGHGGTYNLNIEDRGRDQSAFSMQGRTWQDLQTEYQGHGGVQSAFSIQQGVQQH